MGVDRKLMESLRDRYAMAAYSLVGSYPLITDVYCYQYFGQPVKIVEVNMYDTLANAEVTIETSGMERTRLEFVQLSWDFSRNISGEFCKRSEHDIITGVFTEPETAATSAGMYSFPPAIRPIGGEDEPDDI